MANNLTSNVTRKLMRIFLKHFESNRVVTKTVNTQLFEGKFTPASGTTVDIKRPHDYTTQRTATGDITPTATLLKDSIISGKATATVQDFFTATVDFNSIEEAIELDQLDQIIAPMARRIVTDLEVDFAEFMMANTALIQGVPGTAVTVWSDVAKAGALMSTIGVPQDSPWFYLINPFTQVTLSDQQIQQSGNLTSGIVQSAWEKAQISKNFGGMMALTAQALGSHTSGAVADRVGAVNSAPDATYVTAKDTMTQNIIVDAFGANLLVEAGSVVAITSGPDLLNQSTRKVALDAAGVAIPWRGTVTTTVTLNGSGAGTLVVTGPAIFEVIGSGGDVRNGQYNTVESVIADDDVITILGAASTTFQPNLFYHEQAFSMASVKLPKLFSTDTTVVTEDGFSLRVSKYADGDANVQKVRFDLLPAYAVLNPWFAGQGWK